MTNSLSSKRKFAHYSVFQNSSAILNVVYGLGVLIFILEFKVLNLGEEISCNDCDFQDFYQVPFRLPMKYSRPKEFT